LVKLLQGFEQRAVGKLRRNNAIYHDDILDHALSVAQRPAGS
jgi:hypothetical protein